MPKIRSRQSMGEYAVDRFIKGVLNRPYKEPRRQISKVIETGPFKYLDDSLVAGLAAGADEYTMQSIDNIAGALQGVTRAYEKSGGDLSKLSEKEQEDFAKNIRDFRQELKEDYPTVDTASRALTNMAGLFINKAWATGLFGIAGALLKKVGPKTFRILDDVAVYMKKNPGIPAEEAISKVSKSHGVDANWIIRNPGKAQAGMNILRAGGEGVAYGAGEQDKSPDWGDSLFPMAIAGGFSGIAGAFRAMKGRKSVEKEIVDSADKAQKRMGMTDNTRDAIKAIKKEADEFEGSDPTEYAEGFRKKVVKLLEEMDEADRLASKALLAGKEPVRIKDVKNIVDAAYLKTVRPLLNDEEYITLAVVLAADGLKDGTRLRSKGPIILRDLHKSRVLQKMKVGGAKLRSIGARRKEPGSLKEAISAVSMKTNPDLRKANTNLVPLRNAILKKIKASQSLNQDTSLGQALNELDNFRNTLEKYGPLYKKKGDVGKGPTISQSLLKKAILDRMDKLASFDQELASNIGHNEAAALMATFGKVRNPVRKLIQNPEYEKHAEKQWKIREVLLEQKRSGDEGLLNKAGLRYSGISVDPVTGERTPRVTVEGDGKKTIDFLRNVVFRKAGYENPEELFSPGVKDGEAKKWVVSKRYDPRPKEFVGEDRKSFIGFLNALQKYSKDGIKETTDYLTQLKAEIISGALKSEEELLELSKIMQPKALTVIGRIDAGEELTKAALEAPDRLSFLNAILTGQAFGGKGGAATLGGLAMVASWLRKGEIARAKGKYDPSKYMDRVLNLEKDLRKLDEAYSSGDFSKLEPYLRASYPGKFGYKRYAEKFKEYMSRDQKGLASKAIKGGLEGTARVLEKGYAIPRAWGTWTRDVQKEDKIKTQEDIDSDQAEATMMGSPGAYSRDPQSVEPAGLPVEPPIPGLNLVPEGLTREELLGNPPPSMDERKKRLREEGETRKDWRENRDAPLPKGEEGTEAPSSMPNFYGEAEESRDFNQGDELLEEGAIDEHSPEDYLSSAPAREEFLEEVVDPEVDEREKRRDKINSFLKQQGAYKRGRRRIG